MNLKTYVYNNINNNKFISINIILHGNYINYFFLIINQNNTYKREIIHHLAYKCSLVKFGVLGHKNTQK